MLTMGLFKWSGRVTQPTKLSLRLQLQVESVLTLNPTVCAVESMNAGPDTLVTHRDGAPDPSWRIASTWSATIMYTAREPDPEYGGTV